MQLLNQRTANLQFRSTKRRVVQTRVYKVAKDAGLDALLGATSAATTTAKASVVDVLSAVDVQPVVDNVTPVVDQLPQAAALSQQGMMGLLAGGALLGECSPARGATPEPPQHTPPPTHTHTPPANTPGTCAYTL